jgi:ATP-dependent helicase/nuclease subunit A
LADLRVISAGAGTGKTHRLAQELLGALTDPVTPVSPEGVVAVTYTRSAAAELETRVRTALIDAGRTDLARRLAAARIGTVHSVCARLIEEHAFALGLSPELETIDDVVAAGLFEDALAASITDAERLTLDDLEQRFSLGNDASAFFKSVRHLVNRARSNEFDDDDLIRSRDASVASLLENLPASRTATEVEQGLLRALQSATTNATDRGTDAWRDALDVARRMARRLEQGQSLSWNEWLQLEGSRFASVRKAAEQHVEHEGLRQDLATMTGLMFDVARRTIARYRDDKRAAGVVDFTDQEHLALQAVQTPEVKEALGADVQLLLVDEFQDTSPLQMQLFDALRRVASRTVIVGDDKQSIFGFRDARPDLFMRMADEADHTDRLGVSWRSRPGLVQAVSAVFAAAFSGQRRPEDVVLTAALQHEPPGLGAHVERWAEAYSENPNGGGERAKDEEIISAGIAEALATRDIPIRPTSSTSKDVLIKPAQARDFAVLCRSNSECRAVARALHRRGVPAVLGRRALSKTFEARVIGAALALWLDPKDVLARIALVHLLADSHNRHDDPNGDDDSIDDNHTHSVLADVATAERGKVFVDHPLVVTLTAAATAAPFAGLVLAFDRAVDVLRLTEHLAALPGPAQRLADVAALRALAVRFVDESFARGRGPTIAGYLDRLETLRTASRDDDESDDDNRGGVAGEDAVSVLTYHRAKGKEWPVVILAGLWSSPWVQTFDTVVEPTVALPDLSRPSFGHTLRAWPSPYGERSRKNGLFQVLKASPAIARAEKAVADEGRRLLYVGFTRARDRLVFIGDQSMWSRGLMSTLVVDGRPLCSDPPGSVGTARWAGVDVDATVHHPNLAARVPARSLPLVMPPHPTGPRPVRPPMFLQPSAQEGTGQAGESITLGADVTVLASTRDELNPLGQCVHAFLAWDAFVDVNSAADDANRRHRAQQMLERFEVQQRATTQQLITMADRLWSALQTRFPGHRRRTEVPMLQRLPTGSMMRGQLDLLLDLPDGGAVIVDHKTTWDGDVAGYAGQLQAYRSAVLSAGATSVSTWIHLPLLGRLVDVAMTEPASSD